MSLWADAAKQALKENPGKKAGDAGVVSLAKRIYAKLRSSAGGAAKGAATKAKAVKTKSMRGAVEKQTTKKNAHKAAPRPSRSPGMPHAPKKNAQKAAPRPSRSPGKPHAPPNRQTAGAHPGGVSLWAQAVKQALEECPGKEARDDAVVLVAKRVYSKLRRSATRPPAAQKKSLGKKASDAVVARLTKGVATKTKAMKTKTSRKAAMKPVLKNIARKTKPTTTKAKSSMGAAEKPPGKKIAKRAVPNSSGRPSAPLHRPAATAHKAGTSLWAQALQKALKECPGKEAREASVVLMAKRIYGTLRRPSGGGAGAPKGGPGKAARGAAPKAKAAAKVKAARATGRKPPVR